jgi:pyrrolidone-carboxylate peptidase
LVYPNNVEHYLEMLLHDQPPYILGLGTYSGVDQDQIRKVTINSFLSENSQMKSAEAMGNSHCNLVSWKIMQLINQGKLNAQYTFLHIPKNMKMGCNRNN